MCNAVERSPKVKWIGCANELNAAYAADGYARIRGVGMLATTYGVGELSALNGVMGAKAERSLVFHVVGMPSYQNQRLGKIAHHTLGDGNFGNFAGLSAAAACCSALINPDNCVIELERMIAEARRNNQPAYILVPSDYALASVTPVDVRPLMLKSSKIAKSTEAVPDRSARHDLWKRFRSTIPEPTSSSWTKKLGSPSRVCPTLCTSTMAPTSTAEPSREDAKMRASRSNGDRQESLDLVAISSV
jgi:TPP-dependent 2-oxoacid decarboxylase